MDRLQQILHFLQESPNDPFLNYAIAQEYWKIGKRTEAIEKYEWLVENHPNYVGTYYHLGKAYLDAGDKTRAMETYEKGISQARLLKEQHALAELQSAKLALEYDDED